MFIQGYGISYKNIIDNISFRLDAHSRVGLVGDNGAGKTTLLKLISGTWKPDGIIKKEMLIGLLAQEVENQNCRVMDLLYRYSKELLTLREKIEKYNGDDYSIFTDYQDLGGWDFEVQLEKLLDRFKFKKTDIYRVVSELSGGEKTKINLIALLLQKPDIMLLDEPTNHLDLETTIWLENYLKNQRVPYLLVSHDREFLDKTVTTIWEIDSGKLEEFPGNYSFYKKSKDDKYNLELHLHEQQQKKINKLNKSLKSRKSWGLSHQGETGPNGYAPIYEDVKNRAKDTMRNAKVMESRINLLIEKEEKKKPVLKEPARIIFEEMDTRYGKNCLALENLEKSFNRTLFQDLNIVVKHGDKLAITGLNGSGKTTLLKMIMGFDKDYSGRIVIPRNLKMSYFSQEFDNLNYSNTILNEVSREILYNQGNIRKSLASIGFKGEEVFRKVSDLSSGEKSKVALVKAMLSHSQLLILDEPTNHLEIRTREVVEEALKNYKGTVIFVSHDRRFIKNVATKKYSLTGY